MAEQSGIDWAAIRAAFEGGTDSLSSVALRFQVSRSAAYSRSRREGWTQRAKGGATNKNKRTPDVSDQAIARRLRQAIQMQLERLENRMKTETEASAADHERDTRSLGGIIRNLEKLSSLSHEPVQPSAPSQNEATPPSMAGNDEQDAFRSQVAARIVRLHEQLRDRSG